MRNEFKLKDLFVHPSHCKVCHLAKQKPLPFDVSNIVTHSPFELIRLDIWGPFHHLTHEGYCYLLTIVDDFSHFTQVYLLHAKFDVISIFPDFFKLIQTQFGVDIKIFIMIMHLSYLFLIFFFLVRE